MTTGGWIFMIVSVAFVVALTAYCYYRVLIGKREITKPPDILGG